MAGLIRILNAAGDQEEVRRIEGDGQLTIGRTDLADLAVKDEFASRVHCAIEAREGRFTVVDMGSGNGTKVNGKLISGRTELHGGDRISIGKTDLLFAIEAEPKEDEEAKRRKKPNPFRTLRKIDETVKSGQTWRLGDYAILERMAKGGMGSVYRAVQHSASRTVALKILSPDQVLEGNTVERFMREAKSAMKLDHPNVVAAYDAGQEEGLYYFTMELVEGTSLGKILRKKKRISEKDVVRVALDVVDALEHAAELEMVHRDVKPDNVMITREGQVKLCDFGLAKPRHSEGPALTAPGFRVGTPTYMSPEQIETNVLDKRSDIYSLGATLFHAATGSKPFRRETPFQVMTAHVADPLPDPRSVNPDLSEGLAAVICKMMEKKPENRYQTFDELRDALQAAERDAGSREAAPEKPRAEDEPKEAPEPVTAGPAPEAKPRPEGERPKPKALSLAQAAPEEAPAEDEPKEAPKPVTAGPAPEAKPRPEEERPKPKALSLAEAAREEAKAKPRKAAAAGPRDAEAEPQATPLRRERGGLLARLCRGVGERIAALFGRSRRS